MDGRRGPPAPGPAESMDREVIAVVSREPQVAVSVVIPCFNAEATVVRSVESIAAQELLPLEVIAVDDGSRDSTASILANLSRGRLPFPFRVVTLHDNHGPGDARNAGLECVSPAAKYVAFQDADDVWLPWKLDRQIAWMERHPECDWTAHRCCVAGDGGPSSPRRGEMTATPITRHRLLLRNAVATPAVVVRRAVSGWFRPGWRHCEDLMLWLDWLDDGHRGCMLDATMLCLGRRPRTPGGSTGDRAAMYRGERHVLLTLAAEGRLDRGAAMAWESLARLRYLTRLLRR